MKEILDIVGKPRTVVPLPKAVDEPFGLDLANTIPSSIEEYPVHMDDRDDARQVVVWQKVNGGMRSVLLNRTVPRISFLTGILLYAGGELSQLHQLGLK